MRMAMRLRHAVKAGMLICTLTLNVSGVRAQVVQDEAVVIDDVTLIDVESGRAMPHQSVRIAGERIAEIGDAGKVEVPAGVKIISGAGLFLIPGLFNAHVHYTTSPETFAPMLLANGVTAVRDTGADTAGIIALRREANQRGSEQPHIICTGAIIDGDPPVWPFSEPCDTPEEARAAVRKLKDAGVDMIKVYSLLKPDVYRAAIEEAHAQNLKATGHVPNSVSLAEALEAGHDCVEHLMGFEKLLVELSGKPAGDRQGVWSGFSGWSRFPDIDKKALRDRLSRLVEAKMTVCPTLVVIQGIGDAAEPERAKADERMAYVPMSLRSFWGGGKHGEFGKFAGQAVPHMQAMVGELHKAGVPLMIGTDLANPYVFAGFSVHDEMKMFQDAGIAPVDVLRSATIVPARFCAVDDDLGSIAVGKLASLALVRGNPLEDITNCSKIHSAFLRGVHYDAAALEQMLADVREDVKSSIPASSQPAIDLTLPGEVVRRGRYAMKFNKQFDAGVEDFLITRDDEGYHLRCHSQPQGGFQPPMLIIFNIGKDFAFRSAEMRHLTQKPLTATYELKGRTLIAKAGEGDVQESPLPANAIITGPVSASDFEIFGGLDLKVDEKREFQAVGFGFQGWQVAAVPYTITRKADEEITLPDGTKFNARHYATSMTVQGMTMNAAHWVDEQGVLLRSVLRAPFGQVETVLVKQQLN